MQIEILDDIFDDDFRNLVQQDEKIIWEGHPFLSSGDRIILGLKLVIFLLIIGYFIKGKMDPFMIIFSFSMMLGEVYRMYHREKNRYMLTDQRILFQLWRNHKKSFYEIPLSEIKDINVPKKGNHILLKVKNRKKYNFKTYNLNSNEERPYPSLEMIDDVRRVANYIKEEMRNQLPPPM